MVSGMVVLRHDRRDPAFEIAGQVMCSSRMRFFAVVCLALIYAFVFRDAAYREIAKAQDRSWGAL